jgi:methylated-DNA-[protein]-cysteine S-methyltransferase
MILHTRIVGTPIGPLALLAHGGALVGLEFGDARERREKLGASLVRHLGDFDTAEHPDPAGAATRLERYFAGDFAALDEQDVQPHGTPFQLEVWRELRRIPAGSTRGYAELAAAIGRPAAVRAVGAANGANPVSLFVPCHRVIAANGTLWGYGGGLPRKRWLLAHEGAAFVDPQAQGALDLDDGGAGIR